MAKYTKVVDGIRTDFTPAEEAARDAAIEAWKSVEEAREDELAQKAADKASGNQKLKDLGLTDDEIKALTGK
tara:strand:- start:670 stop:885 length:216 start_codon:yes stop_codon:yes gene_type:complete